MHTGVKTGNGNKHIPDPSLCHSQGVYGRVCVCVFVHIWGVCVCAFTHPFEVRVDVRVLKAFLLRNIALLQQVLVSLVLQRKHTLH